MQRLDEVPRQSLHSCSWSICWFRFKEQINHFWDLLGAFSHLGLGRFNLCFIFVDVFHFQNSNFQYGGQRNQLNQNGDNTQYFVFSCFSSWTPIVSLKNEFCTYFMSIHALIFQNLGFTDHYNLFIVWFSLEPRLAVPRHFLVIAILNLYCTVTNNPLYHALWIL